MVSKPMFTFLFFCILVSCSTTSSTDFANLSDMTLCDNVLNYNGRSRASQNARTQELSSRGQDCSAYAHLKRDSEERAERPNQKRRRRPFGKDFPR